MGAGRKVGALALYTSAGYVRLVETISDDLDELVEIERLEDGIADGILRDFLDAALAGGCEDDDVRAMFREVVVDLFDEFVSIEAGHHQVEEDQVEGTVVLNLLETGRAILRARPSESVEVLISGDLFL